MFQTLTDVPFCFQSDSVADVSDVSSNVTLKSYTMHFEEAGVRSILDELSAIRGCGDRGLADTKIPRSGTPVSMRSNRSLSVLRIPSQNPVSQPCSGGALLRSVSQLMDVPDKKALIDDSLWEAILGHDSGLYVDEEDLMNAIKGFSSVTKEHTTFTDTQL
ncbi:Usherin [Camelus dromedarius]|uniref:Usherin n=1 Tax=Camelus dromedarius TaxID=9838 RepID=A0A5N4CJN0_CAMDR|nr:Usherin [Camelus dromedarius]